MKAEELKRWKKDEEKDVGEVVEGGDIKKKEGVKVER